MSPLMRALLAQPGQVEAGPPPNLWDNEASRRDGWRMDPVEAPRPTQADVMRMRAVDELGRPAPSYPFAGPADPGPLPLPIDETGRPVPMTPRQAQAMARLLGQTRQPPPRPTMRTLELPPGGYRPPRTYPEPRMLFAN